MNTRRDNYALALSAAAQYRAERARFGRSAKTQQLADEIDGLVGQWVGAADGGKRLVWPADVAIAAGLPSKAVSS